MTRPLTFPLIAAAIAAALPAAAAAEAVTPFGPTVQVAQSGSADTFAPFPEDRSLPGMADLAGAPVFDSEGTRVGEVFEAMLDEDARSLARVAVEMDDAVAVADEEPLVFEKGAASLVLHDGEPAVRLDRPVSEIL
jgi:sporulation protein YlmC with PRC-barrel domain